MEIGLQYLGTFVAVADYGSISLAAKKLGIAQPAVSRQIKLLEEQFGTALFARDHDGVRLTAAGTKVRDHVSPWLRDLFAIRAGLLGEEGSGKIRFGTLTEAGQYYFMPQLLRFGAERRSVDIEVTYGKEVELRELFKKNDLDIMAVTSPMRRKGILCWPSLQERVVLVCRSSFAGQFDGALDMKHLAFVAYRKKDPLLLAYLAKHYPTLDFEEVLLKYVVNSHRSMIDALVSSDTVAVMPWHSIHDQISARVLRVASKREMNGQLYLVCRQAFAETRLGQALLEYLPGEII